MSSAESARTPARELMGPPRGYLDHLFLLFVIFIVAINVVVGITCFMLPKIITIIIVINIMMAGLFVLLPSS